MIDTYVCASDLDALLAFCGAFENVIGPATGLPASEVVVVEGETIPAREAVGDPSLWYACVRTGEEIIVPEEILVVDGAVGAQIVGVWA